MKEYLGVKLIKAEPQLRGHSFGLEKPNDAVSEFTFNEEGYKVVYEDGYTSWSPKDVFKKAYRPISGLTFGLAIEALKQGKLVSRKGWNGSGMFVFYQIPSVILKNIVSKMSSVPNSVKTLMESREQGLHYQNGMIIVKPDGSADSWVASSSDTFAEDWYIVD